MVEVLKLLEAPGLILAGVVIVLQVGIINKLIKINDSFREVNLEYAKSIQELTTWLKTRFSGVGD